MGKGKGRVKENKIRYRGEGDREALRAKRINGNIQPQGLNP